MLLLFVVCSTFAHLPNPLSWFLAWCRLVLFQQKHNVKSECVTLIEDFLRTAISYTDYSSKNNMSALKENKIQLFHLLYFWNCKCTKQLRRFSGYMLAIFFRTFDVPKFLSVQAICGQHKRKRLHNIQSQTLVSNNVLQNRFFFKVLLQLLAKIETKIPVFLKTCIAGRVCFPSEPVCLNTFAGS